ncbi:hypothetical protein HHK36_004444 [Tetracentron sinense]|uniref:Uncharacterized protein n=1 Tax=Tetracentron sinense TaxID=13715 RepID=A0A835DQ98_TETSI|nr:hypothetical protein HHK36_004444 [Tetracentron sinense]
MDQHGLEACGIGNTVRDLHSHINLDMGGKTKNLSDCREKFTGKSTEFERDWNKVCPNPENNGYKDELFQRVEGEHSSYGKTSSLQNVPSGDCTEGDASSWKPQQSSGSSSSGLHNQAGMYRKDSNFSEGTSVTTSSINEFASNGMKEAAGDGSPKDSQAYKHSSERTVSTRKICVKNEVGSDTGKSFNPEENEELNVGTTKSNEVNAGEYGSKSMMQVSFDGKLLKAETSFSKSKPAICPVSSSDSCQKTSLETKSCSGNKKDSGTKESVFIGFRCSVEESPSKSIALGMAEQHESLDYWKKIMEQKPDKQIDSYIAPKVVLDPSAMLRGKQSNMGKTSEAVETFRGSDTGNMLMMSAEKSSMILDKIGVSKPRLLKQKNAELLSKDKKEIELTDEPDDALEVARRVAREVEQEVGIYKEASGSSSSIEESYCQTVYQSAIDSTEPKKKDCLAGSGDRIQSCSERDNPDSCCSTKEEMEPEMSAGNEQLSLEVKEESREISPTKMQEAYDDLHEQESSQLTTIPDDGAANDQTRYLCGFDLNEDIQAEEMEYPGQPVTETVSSCHVVNVSTPIPVVATSRVPLCFPIPPLQFDGELGWRGSAVTSAFRPASLCKTAYKKAFCIDENNCGGRHSQGFQGIDLNVADAGDNSVMELSPEKHISQTSGLPSGESSVEVSSKRVERLNLDLNRPGDNDDNCLPFLTDWRMEQKLHIRTNGAHSPPTSLSRSSIGDFDLNDNPSFGDAHSEAHRPGQGSRPLRNRTSDDPVVSFAGTTIQLDSSNLKPATWADLGSSMQGFYHGLGHGRMEFLPPAQPFLMAAPNVGPSGRVVPLQATLTYTPPPPSFPCNTGFGVGPTGSHPPTIYPSGVVPYMIDTRGFTTIPQILGSSTLPAFPRAPHFMEVAGGSCPSDIAILRPSLDLNVGIPSLENQSRGGSARQLGIPTSNSLVEEQMKSISQVALSGTSMKRKEPECGWDSYQVGYRHATSWR